MQQVSFFIGNRSSLRFGTAVQPFDTWSLRRVGHAKINEMAEIENGKLLFLKDGTHLATSHLGAASVPNGCI